MDDTIRWISHTYDRNFGIKKKGKIEVGNDTDIALINPWKEEFIRSKNMHSKGKYTPFEGILFKVTVEKTLLRGKVIHDRKNIPEASIGHGKFMTLF